MPGTHSTGLFFTLAIRYTLTDSSLVRRSGTLSRILLYSLVAGTHSRHLLLHTPVHSHGALFLSSIRYALTDLLLQSSCRYTLTASLLYYSFSLYSYRLIDRPRFDHQHVPSIGMQPIPSLSPSTRLALKTSNVLLVLLSLFDLLVLLSLFDLPNQSLVPSIRSYHR